VGYDAATEDCMAYIKGFLSGLAAIILAEFVPGIWWVLRGINGSKATGLGVVAAGLVESLLSPLFWILSILLFALFFLASRLTQRSLRVILFWIPTLTASCVGVVIAALFTYLLVRFRNS
jgi:hypothetical protein